MWANTSAFLFLKNLFIFLKFYFYFILLYNTVLVLPCIDMNPPLIFFQYLFAWSLRDPELHKGVLLWALAYRNIVLLTFYTLLLRLPLSRVCGTERGPGLYSNSCPSWGLWLTCESGQANSMFHTTCQEFKRLLMGSQLVGWPTNLLKQIL